jgi:dTDP-4-amino-4,6-dideoxygalactose transaminase
MGKTDVLAIDGGTPVRTAPWPQWPQVSIEEWQEAVEPALRAVFLSGTEGLPGERAHRVAADLAKRFGVSHAVLTPHGTDALMAALAGALDIDGLGDGGEVLVPSYTFVASASAPLAMRCAVAFVDIDPATFTLDPSALEAAIRPHTTAILPVHLGGQPCDMTAIGRIAARRGLAVIEDCAQAHGAAHRKRPVGGWGTAGAFSFQSSKNLTAGEGGLVTTNDATVWERVASFVDVGRRPGGARWEYPRLGWNYRPSEYLAALLATRLTHFEAQAARRTANAVRLTALLADFDGLTPPALARGCSAHAWHLYQMTYQPAAFGGRTRAEFVRALVAEGVPAWVGYEAPLGRTPALEAAAARHPDRVRIASDEQCARCCATSVWLGQQLLLGEAADMDQVVEAAAKIQAAWTA